MTLDKLFSIIQERKTTRPTNSYVASLFSDDKDRIIQKVGEEATELVIAAKNDSKERIISETADLLFHVLVLLAANDISPDEVMYELDRRDNQ